MRPRRGWMVGWLGLGGALMGGCFGPFDCVTDVSGQWHDETHGGQVRMAVLGATLTEQEALWAREGSALPGEDAVLSMVLRPSDRSSLQQQDQDLVGTYEDEYASDAGSDGPQKVHLDLKTEAVPCRIKPPEVRCDLHYRFALDGVGGERTLGGHIEAWRVTSGFLGPQSERVAQWPVELVRNQPLPETCSEAFSGGSGGVVDGGGGAFDAGSAP